MESKHGQKTSSIYFTKLPLVTSFFLFSPTCIFSSFVCPQLLSLCSSNVTCYFFFFTLLCSSLLNNRVLEHQYPILYEKICYVLASRHKNTLLPRIQKKKKKNTLLPGLAPVIFFFGNYATTPSYKYTKYQSSLAKINIFLG